MKYLKVCFGWVCWYDLGMWNKCDGW